MPRSTVYPVCPVSTSWPGVAHGRHADARSTAHLLRRRGRGVLCSRRCEPRNVVGLAARGAMRDISLERRHSLSRCPTTSERRTNNRSAAKIADRQHPGETTSHRTTTLADDVKGMEKSAKALRTPAEAKQSRMCWCSISMPGLLTSSIPFITDTIGQHPISAPEQKRVSSPRDFAQQHAQQQCQPAQVTDYPLFTSPTTSSPSNASRIRSKAKW